MSTLDEIYKKLMDDALSALDKVMDEGKKLAIEYIEREWYGKYDPVYYDRTMDMLDSLCVDVKIKNNNKIEAILYVREDVHQRSNSTYSYNRTFAEIYEWFATGQATGEDRYGQELDAIKFTKEQLVDVGVALDIIKNTFASRGFILK